MTAYQTPENKNQFTNKPTFSLRIDHNQATTQLEALGYRRGETVYVRALLLKEDPRYEPNTGRKADKLNWEKIHWQNQGYSVTEQYFERAESVGYATLGGVR